VAVDLSERAVHGGSQQTRLRGIDVAEKNTQNHLPREGEHLGTVVNGPPRLREIPPPICHVGSHLGNDAGERVNALRLEQRLEQPPVFLPGLAVRRGQPVAEERPHARGCRSLAIVGGILVQDAADQRGMIDKKGWGEGRRDTGEITARDRFAKKV
jgi:hypothetical protein